MKFSRFTPFGLLRFSNRKPVAQQIYEDLIAAKGDAFDMSEGTYEEAKTFAQAKAYARASRTVERAANTSDPLRTNELLPAMETRYGVVPGPNDTLSDRRATLAAAYRAPSGASSAAITSALQLLLGDDFICYRPLKTSEVLTTVFPSDPTTMGSYVSPKYQRKLFWITDPVGVTGAPLWVSYEPATSNPADRLNAGDQVTIQAENYSLCETVTVLQSGYHVALGTLTMFQATFTKAHDVGASAVLGNMPLWSSMKRYSLVIVSDKAAADPGTRAKIHNQMTKMARGVSQWAIVKASSPSQVGPFQVGDPIGMVPFGTLSYP